MKTLVYKLSGGRPMKRVCTLFTDKVSGESVHHYVDAFGRNWMAASAWSLFRVEKK